MPCWGPVHLRMGSPLGAEQGACWRQSTGSSAEGWFTQSCVQCAGMCGQLCGSANREPVLCREAARLRFCAVWDAGGGRAGLPAAWLRLHGPPAHRGCCHGCGGRQGANRHACGGLLVLPVQSQRGREPRGQHWYDVMLLLQIWWPGTH